MGFIGLGQTKAIQDIYPQQYRLIIRIEVGESGYLLGEADDRLDGGSVASRKHLHVAEIPVTVRLWPQRTRLHGPGGEKGSDLRSIGVSL